MPLTEVRWEGRMEQRQGCREGGMGWSKDGLDLVQEKDKFGGGCGHRILIPFLDLIPQHRSRKTCTSW